MDDDVMARVTAAVRRGQQGERASARQELEAIWAEVEQGGGDDFHRCVIAHFLADLQEDDRDELMWDERALVAVDRVSDERAQEFHESLRVRGFLPSLYLASPTITGGSVTRTVLASSSKKREPRPMRWATTLTVSWSWVPWTRWTARWPTARPRGCRPSELARTDRPRTTSHTVVLPASAAMPSIGR